jgi:sarcosine oxidase subunit alpha
VEEPSALVQLARGARTEPNTRATGVELYEGLSARSQNCWPSVRFDAGAIANALSPLLPAGFYYKTFMWPPTPKGWLRYEHFIRAAAGMGRAASEPDPDRYEHQFAHCDVLVIGGGPAGLAAARAAAASGARVIVCHQSAEFASGLAGSDATIAGRPAARWTEETLSELRARADVTLLARTSAFGYYDGNLVGAVERVTEHLAAPPSHLPRQRLWLIRARAVVLASGAIERGLGYGNNDLPGTLLASAGQTYVTRYGVRLGQRVVLFTNNDAAYASALALHAAGIPIGGIIDSRPDEHVRGTLPERVRSIGLSITPASVVVRAHGRLRVSGVDVAPRGGGTAKRIDCDVLLVSGGCSPAVHLFSHARGTLRYDAEIAALVPDTSPLAIACAGAVNGEFDLARAIDEGTLAGSSAAGSSSPRGEARRRRASEVLGGAAIDPWPVRPPASGAKCFVDLQNDVTVRDIAIAAREGYTLAEHLKRYTTLGMGTDQGKTSNLAGMALLAEHLRVPVADVGTTTFRPPYTPVTLGAVAGHARGAHVEPTRRTSMHAWHAEHGARFVNAGLWKRPHSYPRKGESEDDAADREARNVRANVGIVDVSTLGKIELQGRDVAEFLDRIYINRFDTLAVGRCRYGVMLREDGIVRDDGTMSRLDDAHYLMTTTTANAAAIMQYVEQLLQVDWPGLDVCATSVTEQWAAVAVSGPKSRALLARLVDLDVSNEAFPLLGVATCTLRTAQGPIPARLFRMSYSGELAYEVHVPSRYGRAMWDAIIGEGEAFGLMPYGTEAMNTLRVEKGHVVIGSEIDGRTTAADLGMEKLVNPNKWCVGKPLLARAALNAPDRWQLVGVTARGSATIPRGAKIVADPDRTPPNPMLGHVTSWCASPHVGASIALALVAGGRSRHGESLWAVSPLADARVRVDVGPSCFVDPDGGRLRG